MHGIMQQSSGSAIAKRGSVLPLKVKGAKGCTSKFGAVCKAIWPKDTAKHLAKHTECSIRTAKYRLSGAYQPTVAELLVILNEMFA